MWLCERSCLASKPPAEIEAEYRYSLVRDRVLEERLRERLRFVEALKAKNIHIEEIAGVWLTPDMQFDRAEPKRALYTVLPRARMVSDVDVAQGDVDVAAGPSSSAASASAAAPAAPPVRYVPTHTIGVDMGELKPGELPVLRMLPQTSTVLHCKARHGIFVYGDI